MKFFLAITIILNFLIAKEVEPTHTIEVKGGVTDMVYFEKKVLLATTEGTVEIYNKNKNQIEKIISIEKIKDFTGEEINPKIYSVDINKNKSILICSQGLKGYSKISEYKKGKLKNIIDIDKKLFILRAKYISENKILFLTLSNEAFLYDIKKNKNIWFKQNSMSKYSYFVLNEEKTEYLIADESGDLSLNKVLNGKIIKEFKNKNLDNVFQVDMKQSKIITAGQDQKTVIYDKENNFQYIKKGDFLIYSAGLSPKAKLGAYSKYENNDVLVFDIITGENKYILKDNKMNISKILFLNEEEILVSSDSEIVNYFKIKGE